METIKELENLLLPKEDASLSMGAKEGVRIVVLKQFRFHNALCIEMYDAPVTGGGKIKNPLTYVSATDAGLLAKEAESLLFYNGISRFQHPPSGAKTATDIR